MIEVTGDLWDYHQKHGFICCITTNGFLKRNGEAVMGAGCAKEAVKIHPRLPWILGSHILNNGNTVGWLLPTNSILDSLIAFPVKHKWWQKADIFLIKQSSRQLANIAKNNLALTFLLPRPGCGNGGLRWKDVKKEIKDILSISNVMVITK